MRNVYTKVTLLLTIALIALLIANNLIYYFISKEKLERQEVDNLKSQAQAIHNILDHSREGSAYVERLVGEKLRAVALAIRSRLDPDIDNVTNEELDALARELAIDDVTLLTKEGEGFVLARSSKREEIGLSTNKWGLWNKVFLELYEKKNVTAIRWGDALDHYWTGPYSVSDTNAEEFYKYGYYYDGTTNYIINPFVSNASIRQYEQTIGIASIIGSITASDPSILEIAGFNPTALGRERVVAKTSSGQTYTPRYYAPVFFGTNAYAHEELDEKEIRRAIETKASTSYKADVNGRTILKTFIPVFTDKIDELGLVTDNSVRELEQNLDYYVIGIAIDYRSIQNQLNGILLEMGMIILLVTVVCMLLLLLLNRYFSRSKDQTAIEAQATYVEEMNVLFNNIREQRHDFVNHINTIHALAQVGKYGELRAYTQEVVGEIHDINEMLHIGNPPLAALIQSKLVQAQRKDIRFTYAFSNMSGFPQGVRSVDFVRMLGNLIDNAFDEVAKVEPEQRTVELTGAIEAGRLRFIVRNAGSIDEAVMDRIFESGVTTKPGGRNSGLGLPITLAIVRRYKGTIKVENDNGVKFTIEIPVAS
ncbi:sensor histidine kinase [Paenibacillus xanthanilyticus]|uniref:Sensor histidine kinase n=1 Tax=Paenibacillus xanthanilyticus TaxID=1783531 RepID=A0ABV8K1D4_9BACL